MHVLQSHVIPCVSLELDINGGQNAMCACRRTSRLYHYLPRALKMCIALRAHHHCSLGHMCRWLPFSQTRPALGTALGSGYTHDHIQVLVGLSIRENLADFAVLACLGAEAATGGSCCSEDLSQRVDTSIVYKRVSRCRTRRHVAWWTAHWRVAKPSSREGQARSSVEEFRSALGFARLYSIRMMRERRSHTRSPLGPVRTSVVTC